MTTETTTIRLTADGLSFESAFTTLVSRVINADGTKGKSKIVLDSMPHVQIALGDKTANELKLEKGVSVTIEPIKGADDGSFDLIVGQKAQAPSPTKTPTRGSSPLPGMTFSNALE